jgi:hypothetical protein
MTDGLLAGVGLTEDLDDLGLAESAFAEIRFHVGSQSGRESSCPNTL